MSDLPFGCEHCGSKWSGSLTAHCTMCCKSFTNVPNFDKHILMDYRKQVGYAKCVHPLEVGLIDAGRSYECWRTPGDGTDWQARFKK